MIEGKRRDPKTIQLELGVETVATVYVSVERECVPVDARIGYRLDPSILVIRNNLGMSVSDISPTCRQAVDKVSGTVESETGKRITARSILVERSGTGGSILKNKALILHDSCHGEQRHGHVVPDIIHEQRYKGKQSALTEPFCRQTYCCRTVTASEGDYEASWK